MIYSRGSKPSARIERWVLRLQPYSYKVCCVASRDDIADALSRLTTLPASVKCRYDDEHVRMVALHAVPVSIKIQEIESASAEDKELQAVRNCLASGNWEKGPRSFMTVRNELTFIGQVILEVPGMLRVPTGYKGDNHSACENNQDVREAMARSSTGLTWAYGNRRKSAGPSSGLLQPMGGS